MVDVVAVHGAFRGGWSWDRVRSVLAPAGHRLFAPDLTGMGAGGSGATGGDVTLAQWVGDVVAVVSEHGLTGVVLVGHSMGGVVAQAALGALDGRVARLVLIDSPLVGAGQRAVDVSGPSAPAPELLPPRETWFPPTPVGPEQGYDVPDLAAWVNERLCATPFGPQLDRCPAGPPTAPPTSVVFCDRTPAGYPSTFARCRCDESGLAYTVIDRHHDVPVLDPGSVAALLLG